jgi:hypothetical protein
MQTPSVLPPAHDAISSSRLAYIAAAAAGDCIPLFASHYNPSANITPSANMPVSMPISTLKGSWKRLLDDERLRRSSQVLSVIDQHVCIFGGEVKPREPIDDKIDIVSLKPGRPSFRC